jgi:hypothetical protein
MCPQINNHPGVRVFDDTGMHEFPWSSVRRSKTWLYILGMCGKRSDIVWKESGEIHAKLLDVELSK